MDFLQQKCKIFKEKCFIDFSLHKEKSKRLKEISILFLSWIFANIEWLIKTKGSTA
jgi:hypothetical protein